MGTATLANAFQSKGCCSPPVTGTDQVVDVTQSASWAPPASRVAFVVRSKAHDRADGRGLNVQGKDSTKLPIGRIPQANLRQLLPGAAPRSFALSIASIPSVTAGRMNFTAMAPGVTAALRRSGNNFPIIPPASPLSPYTSVAGSISRLLRIEEAASTIVVCQSLFAFSKNLAIGESDTTALAASLAPWRSGETTNRFSASPIPIILRAFSRLKLSPKPTSRLSGRNRGRNVL